MLLRIACSFLIFCGLLTLFACTTPDDGPWCSIPEEVDSAEARATVDGDSYRADSNVLWEDLGGPGLFVDMPTVDGTMISIGMQFVTDVETAIQTPITEALEGEFPFEVTLGERATEGASMTVTKGGTTSDSGRGDGGRLLITAFDDTTLLGCYEAATDLVTVSNGSFAAEPR